MKKEHDEVNEATEQSEPVTDYENFLARGLAKADELIFHEHLEMVKGLRDRQAHYLDSLPTDPVDVIFAALRIIHPRGGTYPSDLEEALHLSVALEALVKTGDLESETPDVKAAIYFAEQVSDALRRITSQIDRLSDILSNPARTKKRA